LIQTLITQELWVIQVLGVPTQLLVTTWAVMPQRSEQLVLLEKVFIITEKMREILGRIQEQAILAPMKALHSTQGP
jgi:hypothetical protein